MKFFTPLITFVALVAAGPGGPPSSPGGPASPAGPGSQPDFPTDGADPTSPPTLIQPDPPEPINPPGPREPPGCSTCSFPGGPCPRKYAVTGYASQCGNKCETSCQNMGEEVDPQFVADESTGCVWGCSCKEGFVRTDNRDCVRQKRHTCDVDPCEDEPHSIWRRCAFTAGPTCYIRSCKRADVMKSRCVCKPGYSLNLKQECIKTTSSACKRLAKRRGC